MSTPDKVNPVEALERLFAVIREEASVNPTFARRMLDAVGISVAFTGPEATAAADPVLIAARHDYAAFREMFSTFPEPDLKKMVTNHGLGTAEDVRRAARPKKLAYIDMMWEGARRKIAERSSR